MIMRILHERKSCLRMSSHNTSERERERERYKYKEKEIGRRTNECSPATAGSCGRWTEAPRSSCPRGSPTWSAGQIYHSDHLSRRANNECEYNHSDRTEAHLGHELLENSNPIAPAGVEFHQLVHLADLQHPGINSRDEGRDRYME